MSDTEALMWNIEKDPWLNPSGAMVTVLDRPVDRERFTRRIASAILSVPRLRQRVDAPLGRVLAPRWVHDNDFDLSHHLRFVALPSQADTDRDLYALAAQIAQVPYDRTRPLWEMHVVEGLSGGRGALISKMHHAIADGIGAMRMSLTYMDLRRRVAKDDVVDLNAELAALAPPEDDGSTLDGLRSEFETDLGQFFDKVAKPAFSIVRSVAGEVATWGADRDRIGDAAGSAKRQAMGIVEQLPVGENREPGSPLWAERSRQRHLEVHSLGLDEVKRVSAELGGTVNDLFVAGAVHGSVEYHRRRGVELEQLHTSFVLSTRTKGDRSANAFTPVPFDAPATTMSARERFDALHDIMSRSRSDVSGGGLLAVAAGAAKMLPTSLMTRLTRREAGSIDFATSNLRGSPVTVYIGGARAEALYALGPVAGTAFNLTTLSYNGNLDMGLHIDPIAVEDPSDLRECIAEAYADLLGLA